MRCSSDEFYRIGMSQFCRAYKAYCMSKGMVLQKTPEEKNNEYLDFRDEIEVIIERNKDRLAEAREKVRKGS